MLILGKWDFALILALRIFKICKPFSTKTLIANESPMATHAWCTSTPSLSTKWWLLTWWVCLSHQYGGKMASASSEPVCLTISEPVVSPAVSLLSHPLEEETQVSSFPWAMSELDHLTRHNLRVSIHYCMSLSSLSLSTTRFIPRMTNHLTNHSELSYITQQRPKTSKIPRRLLS